MTQKQSRQEKYNAMAGNALHAVVQSFKGKTPAIVDDLFYGDTSTGPGMLTIWYLFATNDDVAEAKRNGTADAIKSATLEALKKEGFPAKSLPDVMVGFASKEEADAAGGSWNYFR